MKLSNNQIGRIQLLLAELLRLKYYYDNVYKSDGNPDDLQLSMSRYAYESLDLFRNHQELMQLSCDLKDVYNRSCNMELVDSNEGKESKAVTNHCDGNHATSDTVKLLPAGGGSNMIVCRACYDKEMEYRRGRIAEGVQFELPSWDTLKTYEGGE